MNNNPKISLTIYLEGSTCHVVGKKRIPWVLRQVDLTPSAFPTEKQKKSKAAQKIVRKGYYKTILKEYVDAQQHITMTQDAYDYMTSNEMPYWFPFHPMASQLAKSLKVSGKIKKKVGEKTWERLSPEQRLEAHMQYTCESFHGKGFSYVVMED